MATAGECTFAAASTAEIPPVGVGIAITGATLCCAAGVYAAYH